ncbi:MAG TPA: hypothetical protein VK075_06390 [Pseudogracilibacillus sp.]|nr:hypothetical protein [Pseudogracilibacillus sp.]
MNKVNIPALLLAFVVIFFFTLVGVALAVQNLLWACLAFLAGFLVMAFGIYLKIKNPPTP